MNEFFWIFHLRKKITQLAIYCRNNKKAWAVIGFIFLAVFFCFLDRAVGDYFYRYAFVRHDQKLIGGRLGHHIAPILKNSSDRPCVRWFKEEQQFSLWKMESRDSLHLKAYYLPARHSSKRLVILVHGYRNNPESMLEFAKFYHEKFNCGVLLPALRGHGLSEGDQIGFGWIDRWDLQDWIHLAIERCGKETEIILHGNSMGAATVLMASGEQLPDNVKAVIADSSYTSLEEIFMHQMKYFPWAPKKLLFSQVDKRLQKEQGFRIKDASVIKQLQKSRIPTLLIHGQEDRFIPIEMAHRLKSSRAPLGSHRILSTFEHAGHIESWSTNPSGYEQLIGSFMAYVLPANEKYENEKTEALENDQRLPVKHISGTELII